MNHVGKINHLYFLTNICHLEGLLIKIFDSFLSPILKNYQPGRVEMIKKIIPSLITYLFNIFCWTNRKLDREITQNPQILVYKLQSIKKNFTYLHNLIFYSPDSRSQLNWPSTTVLLFKQKTSEDDATTLPPSRPS